MESNSPDEAVLARATELYAEGMSLEDSNEPQLALDRYRRAVRMADERKILARLQTHQPGLVGSGPAASAGAPPSAKQSAEAEEEFQLWRAMHLSRLEAGVAGAAGATEARGASDAAGRSEPAGSEPTAPAKPSGRFTPAPRRPAQAPGQETEEDAEEADRLALRALRQKLGSADAAALPTEPEVNAETCGQGIPSAEDAAGLVALLPEVLPDIFAFLEAYSLDRAARVSSALRRLARSSAVWRDLAARCLPRHTFEELQAATGEAAAENGQLWRRGLLFSPRFRADGIYVAPCGYRRRIQKGSSLTDTRESMYIRYFRLLRVLPANQGSVPEPPQVLVLTYEGELALAVEALKTHPVGREATFGAGCSKALGDISSQVRKLQERALVGAYEFDRLRGAITIRYTDARSEYLMEFALSNGRKDGSRQNCRLTWQRYEFTSLTVQDGGSFDLHREQHYAPYAFARVRALEHLL